MHLSDEYMGFWIKIPSMFIFYTDILQATEQTLLLLTKAYTPFVLRSTWDPVARAKGYLYRDSRTYSDQDTIVDAYSLFSR